MTIRVLLVDDQTTIREGLRMRLALEPHLQVVGEAGDGLDSLRQARALDPDVIVMDAEMPRMDGFSATEALQIIAPRSAVVMISIHDGPHWRERAREAGAAAFVPKQTGDTALLAAIHAAAAPDRKI